MKEYIITVDESKPDIMGSVPLIEPPKELIRCKDCRKHGDIACPLWTDAVEFETDDDWFCADGEKGGEVKTGNWIEYPKCLAYDGAYDDSWIVCSSCKHPFNIIDNCAEEFDYCPHCGAKMKGDEVNG